MATAVRRPTPQPVQQQDEGGFLDKAVGGLLGASFGKIAGAPGAVLGAKAGADFGRKNPGTGQAAIGAGTLAAGVASGQPLVAVGGATQGLEGVQRMAAKPQAPAAVQTTPIENPENRAMARRMQSQSSNNLAQLRAAAFAIPDLPQPYRKQAATDILTAYQAASQDPNQRRYS